MLTARPREQGRAPSQNTPARPAIRSGVRKPGVGYPRSSVRGDRSGVRSASARTWLVVCLWAGQAFAAPPPVTVPVDPASFEASPGATGPFGFLDGISRSGFMLGDMWGLRTYLSQYGMSFAMQETSEVLGNVSGGARTGFAYDGLTQMILQLDTQRAFGLYGGTFNVSALQIHGHNLSAENLLTLQTASGIEADRATRLWELWYQQKFLDEDRLDIKIGQQSLDQEFMVSQNALLFVNTMFGWPMLPSADLPGGGPAYPLSALGVRVRARPTDSLTFLAGVFNGSPVPNNSGDPQQDKPIRDELSVERRRARDRRDAIRLPVARHDALRRPGRAAGRACTSSASGTTAKHFADQDVDNTGLSLANPASTGIPRMHHGDYSIYAVADQMVWQ